MSKKISLRHILACAVMLMAASIVLSSIGLHFFVGKMRHETGHMRKSVSSVRVAEQLRASFLEYDRYGILYSISGSERYLQLQDTSRKTIDALLKEAAWVEANSDAIEIVNEAKNSISEYFNMRQRWKDLNITPVEYVELSSPRLKEVMEVMGRLTRANVREANVARTNIFKLENLSLKFTMVLFVLFITFTGALVFLTNEFFFKPIRQIEKFLLNFVKGKETPMPEQRSAETQYIADDLISLTRYVKEEDERRMHYVAGIAHDLRSPLTAFLNQLEMIELLSQHESADKARLAKPIQNSKEQVERLNDYIDQILDASMVHAGAFELEMELCNICELLTTVVEQWKSIHEERTFKLECEESVAIVCDKRRMEQVLNNLISNALKYSREEHPIKAHVRKVGEWVEIVIEDFGIGVPEDELDEVFLPYKRSKLAKELATGTGLGLSNVKRIVEAHHGEVFLESESEQGSRFYIRLPLREGDRA